MMCASKSCLLILHYLMLAKVKCMSFDVWFAIAENVFTLKWNDLKSLVMSGNNIKQQNLLWITILLSPCVEFCNIDNYISCIVYYCSHNVHYFLFSFVNLDHFIVLLVALYYNFHLNYIMHLADTVIKLMIHYKQLMLLSGFQHYKCILYGFSYRKAIVQQK